MMIDKDYLRMHTEHRLELEDELRRLELMGDPITYKSPSNIDGMPHAIGGAYDKMADAIIKRTDSDTRISYLNAKVKEEEQAIEQVLSHLPMARQKTVIRIRYYQNYDWDDVALFMFGDQSDYASNSEKYKSKAQKIHGTALANMKRIQEKNGGNI